MADTGWVNFATFSGWTNSSNAASSNDSYATVGYPYTAVLLCTNGNFSAIPDGADPASLGFYGGIERHGGTRDGECTDISVKLIIAGSATGNNRASASIWPTTDAYAYYGSGAGSDLWGTTPTIAQVKASNFGLAIVASSAVGTPNIDHVRMKIFYSAATKRVYDILRSGGVIPFPR